MFETSVENNCSDTSLITDIPGIIVSPTNKVAREPIYFIQILNTNNLNNI